MMNAAVLSLRWRAARKYARQFAIAKRRQAGTGGSGRVIVRDALAKGHSVVVLVRSKPAPWISPAD